MSNQSYSQTTTYILVVIAAIIFGLLGYWYGTNNSGGFSTLSVNALIPQPSQSPSAEITNWKLYNNDKYGFSFKYPSDWQKPKFLENRNFGEPDNAPVTWITTEALDNNKIYSLSFNSKDYIDYGSKQITKPINPSWTQEEFEAQITSIKPLIYKKLSEKALLVGYYSNVECSPSLSLEVLSPLNNDYLNLHIFVNGKFDQNQIIKDRDAQNIAANQDSCDLEEEFSQLAKQVQEGTYSEALYNDIEIARQIADSVSLNKLD